MLFSVFFVIILFFLYNSFFFAGTLTLLLSLIFPFFITRKKNQEINIFHFVVILFLILSLRDGTAAIDLLFFINMICLSFLIISSEKIEPLYLLFQIILYTLVNLFLNWEYIFLFFFVLLQIFFLTKEKKFQIYYLFYFIFFFVSLIFFLNIEEISFQKFYIKDFVIWLFVSICIFLCFRINLYIRISFLFVCFLMPFFSKTLFFSIFSLISYIYTIYIYGGLKSEGYTNYRSNSKF